jgi:hypothetical protein
MKKLDAFNAQATNLKVHNAHNIKNDIVNMEKNERRNERVYVNENL